MMQVKLADAVKVVERSRGGPDASRTYNWKESMGSEDSTDSSSGKGMAVSTSREGMALSRPAAMDALQKPKVQSHKGQKGDREITAAAAPAVGPLGLQTRFTFAHMPLNTCFNSEESRHLHHCLSPDDGNYNFGSALCPSSPTPLLYLLSCYCPIGICQSVRGILRGPRHALSQTVCQSISTGMPAALATAAAVQVQLLLNTVLKLVVQEYLHCRNQPLSCYGCHQA